VLILVILRPGNLTPMPYPTPLKSNPTHNFALRLSLPSFTKLLDDTHPSQSPLNEIMPSFGTMGIRLTAKPRTSYVIDIRVGEGGSELVLLYFNWRQVYGDDCTRRMANVEWCSMVSRV
jgi:hypothetical protein